MPAAHFLGLGPGLVLAQHPDDLLLAEATPFHRPSPFQATDSTSFRLSFRGAGHYHLNRWAGSFVYLDTMVWDTPMFDEGVLEVVRGHPDSNLIDHRYVRALAFRNYL